jgi:hypothetical protein
LSVSVCVCVGGGAGAACCGNLTEQGSWLMSTVHYYRGSMSSLLIVFAMCLLPTLYVCAALEVLRVFPGLNTPLALWHDLAPVSKLSKLKELQLVGYSPIKFSRGAATGGSIECSCSCGVSRPKWTLSAESPPPPRRPPTPHIHFFVHLHKVLPMQVGHVVGMLHGSNKELWQYVRIAAAVCCQSCLLHSNPSQPPPHPPLLPAKTPQAW